MSKRRNDTGHLSKEEYESMQDRDNDEDGGDSGGPRKASKDVMATRRILKVGS